jgi:hypothetical protein
MKRSARQVAGGAFFMILLAVASGSVSGQELSSETVSTSDEHPATEQRSAIHEAEEHEFHRNHFGGLVGVSTHLDTDDSAFTLGLDYVRVFSRRWAAVVYLEQLSSDLERDTIVAAGVIYYPMRGLGVVLAPGLEGATRTVEEHGETVQEDELELLLRLSVAYAFPVAPTAGIGPVVAADWAGNRWTVVFGVGMGVAF